MFTTVGEIDVRSVGARKSVCMGATVTTAKNARGLGSVCITAEKVAVVIVELIILHLKSQGLRVYHTAAHLGKVLINQPMHADVRRPQLITV